MINFKPILSVIGIQLLVVGGLMLTAIPFSIYFEDGDVLPMLYSAVITIAAGAIMRFTTYNSQASIGKKEGYLIVAFGWIAMVTFGALPYIFTGVTESLTDAFFETMSGMTTTGATIFTDIEVLPKGLLYWRSLTQWIGGMGIIVLTVAIFPLLGIGGIELFVAEAPGPTSDKIHPRIQGTAKRLWYLYVGLTSLLFIILWTGEMDFYDAINHAFTTLATGGFSTKNASIAYWSSGWVQYPITLFMLIAGTNYTVIYLSVSGKWKRVWQYDEFRAYIAFLFTLIAIVTGVLWLNEKFPLEQSFRESAFMVVSIVTTTGYVVADYTAWTPWLTLFFFILMFSGANAGSTSGGIKFVRHYVFGKNIYLEFKRLLHPRAIIPLKLNGYPVSGKILINILVFLLLYLGIFMIGSILCMILGLDFITAIGAVGTSLGNVGPGIGEVGPVDNFAHLSSPIKWFLSFIMILGRLELFTILILFLPYFWRSK